MGLRPTRTGCAALHGRRDALARHTDTARLEARGDSTIIWVREPLGAGARDRALAPRLRRCVRGGACRPAVRVIRPTGRSGPPRPSAVAAHRPRVYLYSSPPNITDEGGRVNDRRARRALKPLPPTPALRRRAVAWDHAPQQQAVATGIRGDSHGTHSL